MLLLLGILKRNNKYYMNVVNTEKESTLDDYQFINQYILNQCANIRVSRFLSNKQNPLEYLKGDFDVSRLIVDDNKLRDRIKDYQIIEIYDDKKGKPILYKAIDRAGNIRLHDISEFYYTCNNSILGNDINKLPKFVEHKPVSESIPYLKTEICESDFLDIPIGLLKLFLINCEGFKEGYHTITSVSNGINYDIHEHMLFNGIITVKLIEYVSKDKKVFMTKQDNISNPYPKERTAGFLSGPIILLGSKRVLKKFCKFGVSTEFEFYNKKNIKLTIPFTKETIDLYDKYIKSKDVLFSWQLDFNENISLDIYKNILPNELFKLPSIFYRNMKSIPFGIYHQSLLANENINIDLWMHTVSLLISWQFLSPEFKKSIKPVVQNFDEIYANVLTRLVNEVGPRDALTVMTWTKEHLKERLKLIKNSDPSYVDEFECLFSFYQNEFDLPCELRVYKEETILEYGGLEKLKQDYTDTNKQRKMFIINNLEKIEKELNLDASLDLEHNLEGVLRELKNNN